jgi:hypothetical protein
MSVKSLQKQGLTDGAGERDLEVSHATQREVNFGPSALDAIF